MSLYSLSTACRWLGNSPAVAATHYAMSVDQDGDLQKAIQVPEKPQQNPQHIPQQQALASTCVNGKAMDETHENIDNLHNAAHVHEPVQSANWALRGSNPRPYGCDPYALTN